MPSDRRPVWRAGRRDAHALSPPMGTAALAMALLAAVSCAVGPSEATQSTRRRLPEIEPPVISSVTTDVNYDYNYRVFGSVAGGTK